MYCVQKGWCLNNTLFIATYLAFLLLVARVQLSMEMPTSR